MADMDESKKGFSTALAERGGESMAVGSAVLDPVMKVGKVFKDGAMAAAGYQSVIRDIAMKAGIVGHGSEAALGEKLALTARDNGMERLALGKAVDQMVGSGVAFHDALTAAPVLTQFAGGQQVSSDDSATLMASLMQDAKLPVGKLNQALATVAKFGKDNNVSRAELAQVLPGMLRDMGKLGLTGEEALNQAHAVLSVKIEGGKDVKDAAKEFHATTENLRGRGSEAEAAKALAAVRVYAPVGSVETADTAILAKDHQDVRAKSESKWTEAGQAHNNLSVSIGDALRPASDLAADTLAALANATADVAKACPPLVLSIAAVTAAFGAYGALKLGSGMLSVGVGKTLAGLGIGKGRGDAAGAADAAENKGVQRVFVTNMPGRGMGGANGPDVDRDGRRRRNGGGQGRPRGLLGRAWSGVKSVGSTAVRGALAARGALAGALNTPLLKHVAVKAGVIGAVYQGVQVVRAFAGNGTDREKAQAVGGTLAGVAGSVVGGLLGGPAGAMIGSAAGTALWARYGDKVLDWRDARAAKDAPATPVAAAVSAMPPPAVGASMAHGALPFLGARPPQVVDASMQRYIAGLNVAGVSGVGAPATAPLAWPLVAPAAKSPVPLLPAGGIVAASVASAAAPAAAAAKLSTAPDREAVLKAAADAAAAPATQQAGGKAAAPRAGSAAGLPNQTQFNFKPSISVTVSGDVREPRRIADELMPYLRQLFDQYSGQQQRGSMYDVPQDLGVRI